MIVAIHQPQYLPWVPYFDKLDAADTFVYLDNVAYNRRGVQNRNQIKTPHGAHWLTVPVHVHRGQLIQEVTLTGEKWVSKHAQGIAHHYARAAHRALYESDFAPLYRRPWTHLAELNIAMTEAMRGVLGITTPAQRASELGVSGGNNALLIDICRALGADVYLSGQGAKAYLDLDAFRAAGIRVVFQRYANQPYRQCFPKAGFVPDLSALDLILNEGPAAREIMLAGRKSFETP